MARHMAVLPPVPSSRPIRPGRRRCRRRWAGRDDARAGRSRPNARPRTAASVRRAFWKQPPVSATCRSPTRAATLDDRRREPIVQRGGDDADVSALAQVRQCRFERGLPIDEQGTTLVPALSKGKGVGLGRTGLGFELRSCLAFVARPLPQVAEGREGIEQPPGARRERCVDAARQRHLEDVSLGGCESGNGRQVCHVARVVAKRRMQQAKRRTPRLAAGGFSARQPEGPQGGDATPARPVHAG